MDTHHRPVRQRESKFQRISNSLVSDSSINIIRSLQDDLSKKHTIFSENSCPLSSIFSKDRHCSIDSSKICSAGRYNHHHSRQTVIINLNAYHPIETQNSKVVCSHLHSTASGHLNYTTTVSKSFRHRKKLNRQKLWSSQPSMARATVILCSSLYVCIRYLLQQRPDS